MTEPGAEATSSSNAAEVLEGMTVLVTGGAGFIGSHLVDALVSVADVHVLDDLSNGSQENVPDEASCFRGNVCDDQLLRIAMDGVDIVFHHAAEVSVGDSINHPRRHHETNVTGTVQVLEAARRADARVVLASSAAVYGDPNSIPVTEDEPMTPSSPYGVSKLAADHYARTYTRTYGLETVTLRYFNVYGPRQRPEGDGGVVATFVERATRGEDLVIHGGGQQTRDFLHVDDVVRANLAAATTDSVGRAFNVGTGRAESVNELARLVREYADASITVRHTEARDGDIRHSRADITRAEHELGFEPVVSLEDGLSALLARTPKVEAD